MAQDKLLEGLPEELRPAYDAGAPRRQDPEIREIVRAADKLSAYLKCLEELHAGNQEFLQASRELRTALDGFGLPELEWFFSRFGNTFGVTLDELK